MFFNYLGDLWHLRCSVNKIVLFWRNKSKFVSLNKLLLILSFILLTAFSTQAQSDPVPVDAQRIIKLYPNPATSFIKFDFQKGYSKGYTLQVVNFIGKQVQEVKNVTPSTTIELASYARGLYVYQLRDASGKVVESGKFQVSK